MSRILTGIQSTGRPHLGNLLGAILPAIELSKNPANDTLFFIADLHSLTTVRDPALLPLIRAVTPTTPLSLITTGMRFMSWDRSPESVMRMSMRALARAGLRRLQIAEPMNDTAAALTVAIAPALPSADLRPDYRPAAYAIRGATVVPVEGLPIKDGTIVVRDGVIEAVGPAAEVDIPYDAEVIEACDGGSVDMVFTKHRHFRH